MEGLGRRKRRWQGERPLVGLSEGRGPKESSGHRRRSEGRQRRRATRECLPRHGGPGERGREVKEEKGGKERGIGRKRGRGRWMATTVSARCRRWAGWGGRRGRGAGGIGAGDDERARPRREGGVDGERRVDVGTGEQREKERATRRRTVTVQVERELRMDRCGPGGRRGKKGPGCARESAGRGAHREVGALPCFSTQSPQVFRFAHANTRHDRASVAAVARLPATPVIQAAGRPGRGAEQASQPVSEEVATPLVHLARAHDVSRRRQRLRMSASRSPSFLPPCFLPPARSIFHWVTVSEH